MKIGIIREEKAPTDARVVLTPAQCHELNARSDIQIKVQSSSVRAFKDSEYIQEGVRVVEDVSDCDILLGVKEVPVDSLLEDKTYFIFSHTIKKQPYNRELLRTALKRNITLVDYEVLTDERGLRLIAFGEFAGMVGAHNALWAYGKRTGNLSLPRMYECKDYKEVVDFYNHTVFPRCKLVLTGTGRVAGGAARVLKDMGFKRIEPSEFPETSASSPIFTQLGVTDYAQRPDGSEFSERDYFESPQDFVIDFSKWSENADIMINGIYWDPAAPPFFTLDDISSDKFRIQVIADVTCDIAPVSSIPTTIRAATIASPVFGFERDKHAEVPPFSENAIDMMTVDNLPNELPRDASTAFGEQFIERILPELLKQESRVITDATIAQDGQLGPKFGYLADYAGLGG